VRLNLSPLQILPAHSFSFVISSSPLYPNLLLLRSIVAISQILPALAARNAKLGSFELLAQHLGMPKWHYLIQAAVKRLLTRWPSTWVRRVCCCDSVCWCGGKIMLFSICALPNSTSLLVYANHIFDSKQLFSMAGDLYSDHWCQLDVLVTDQHIQLAPECVEMLLFIHKNFKYISE